MESNRSEHGKQVTVRVMSQGQEIDRCTCTSWLEEGVPTVSYRQQAWPIEDGCIHLDDDSAHPSFQPNWAQLIDDLLPASLPDSVDACADLLQTSFRKNLPPGIAKAAGSLTALRLELQARSMLVEFFMMHRDAPRLYRVLQMQELFRRRTKRPEAVLLSPPSSACEHPAASVHSDTELDWEWSPSPDTTEAPKVDDHLLRAAACRIQERIGRYKAKEAGAPIPEFGDAINTESMPLTPHLTTKNTPADRALVERTLKLGPVAIDVLKYFSYNPGDKAAHAEAVLEHPLSDINRLLLGSLGPYMRRDGSGGWDCQDWVHEVLAALDGADNDY